MIHKLRLQKLPTFLILGAVIIISTIISISILGSYRESGIPPITQYTLTIHLDTTMAVGDTTITGAGIYNEGTVVNIRANPDLGWEFVEWTGDIGTVTNRFSSDTKIIMNGNYNITANFTFPVITHTVSNVVFNPQWPATLNYGERKKFDFEFSGNDKTAVFIFARPFSNGALSPGYLSSGITFYNPWQHEGESDFTINLQPGQVVVDQIRFQIVNILQSKILYECFIPVSYTFQ